MRHLDVVKIVAVYKRGWQLGNIGLEEAVGTEYQIPSRMWIGEAETKDDCFRWDIGSAVHNRPQRAKV